MIGIFLFLSHTASFWNIITHWTSPDDLTEKTVFSLLSKTADNMRIGMKKLSNDSFEFLSFDKFFSFRFIVK